MVGGGVGMSCQFVYSKTVCFFNYFIAGKSKRCKYLCFIVLSQYSLVQYNTYPTPTLPYTLVSLYNRTMKFYHHPHKLSFKEKLRVSFHIIWRGNIYEIFGHGWKHYIDKIRMPAFLIKSQAVNTLLQLFTRGILPCSIAHSHRLYFIWKYYEHVRCIKEDYYSRCWLWTFEQNGHLNWGTFFRVSWQKYLSFSDHLYNEGEIPND